MRALFDPRLREHIRACLGAAHGVAEEGNLEGFFLINCTKVSVGYAVPWHGSVLFFTADFGDDNHTVTDEQGNILTHDEETGVTTATAGDGAIAYRLDAAGTWIRDEAVDAETDAGKGALRPNHLSIVRNPAA